VVKEAIRLRLRKRNLPTNPKIRIPKSPKKIRELNPWRRLKTIRLRIREPQNL